MAYNLRASLLILIPAALAFSACAGGGGSGGEGDGGGQGGSGGITSTGGSGGSASGGGGGGGGGATGSGGAAGGNGGGGATGSGGGGGNAAVGGTSGSDVCAGFMGLKGSPLPASPMPTQVTTPMAEFMEGPVWIASANHLLFSAWNWGDDPGSKGPQTTIYKLTPPSQVEVWSAKGEIRSNGLALDPAGKLLVAAHDLAEIARVDLATKARMTVASMYGGKSFNSPNDLTVRKDGTIYFTDPDYQRSGRPGQGQVQGVYRIAPDKQVFPVDLTRQQPNGIALSPDQTWLYVGGGDSKIKKHAVNADGSVGMGQDFATPFNGIDGLTVDCAGNVYATIHSSNEVRVYSPQGMELGKIPTGVAVTNVAFGGADKKTLYITTAGKLLSLQMNVPGLPY